MVRTDRCRPPIAPDERPTEICHATFQDGSGRYTESSRDEIDAFLAEITAMKRNARLGGTATMPPANAAAVTAYPAAAPISSFTVPQHQGMLWASGALPSQQQRTPSFVLQQPQGTAQHRNPFLDPEPPSQQQQPAMGWRELAALESKRNQQQAGPVQTQQWAVWQQPNQAGQYPAPPASWGAPPAQQTQWPTQLPAWGHPPSPQQATPVPMQGYWPYPPPAPQQAPAWPPPPAQQQAWPNQQGRWR